ncbi:MAG TPA: NAD(P)H-binding protein [Acetobacteraceae bacterium]
MMRLVIFGGAGRIGQRVVQEALSRGHEVTVVLHALPRLEMEHPRLRYVTADVNRADAVADAAMGHDAAVSAVGPGRSGDVGVIVAAARALVAGLVVSGPRRLIVVGGAGTLEIRPGVQRLDTPEFPEAYRPSGYAQREALALYRASDLDWSYLSPPIVIEPGERTGRYRLGDDQVLFDSNGRSRISMEDYAVALLDELERPRHIRARFTVAD